MTKGSQYFQSRVGKRAAAKRRLESYRKQARLRKLNERIIFNRLYQVNKATTAKAKEVHTHE